MLWISRHESPPSTLTDQVRTRDLKHHLGKRAYLIEQLQVRVPTRGPVDERFVNALKNLRDVFSHAVRGIVADLENGSP